MECTAEQEKEVLPNKAQYIPPILIIYNAEETAGGVSNLQETDGLGFVS